MPLPEDDRVPEQLLPQRLIAPLDESHGVGGAVALWPKCSARAIREVAIRSPHLGQLSGVESFWPVNARESIRPG